LSNNSIIISPRATLATMVWAVMMLLLGGVLVYAGMRDANSTITIIGVVIAVCSIPLFLRYKQTSVDSQQGTWTRKEGGLFGSKTTSGSLSEIIKISVRQGVDTKGHKCWEVTLVPEQGKNIPWHFYSYLGEAGMNKSIAQLEAAIGVPVDRFQSRE